MANPQVATSTPINSPARTPNQIAASQPTSVFSNPNPYMPPASSTSVNPTGTTTAPAVHTSTPAANVSTAAQTKNANAIASNASVAAAKQNMTTTYDAQGNMIKTGGVMSNGNTYQEMYSKGQPGYIPNPADAKALADKQQQQQQNQQTSALTSALTPSQLAGQNTNNATGDVTQNNGNINGSSSQVPAGIDVTTQDGQATWYNQDQQGYEQWANANNISSDQQFQVEVLAGNQQLVSIQNQGNNALQQYRTGLLNNEEAQISALTNLWNTTISAQRNANDSYVAASALASARAGGQYDPMGSLASAQQAIQTGLDRVTEFQNQEQSAIADVQNAFLTNDYNAVTANLAQQEKLQADMTNNLKIVNDSITKAKEDAQAQANYVATTQYNEVTKPIEDMTETVTQAGAPASVVSAVENAKTVQDAITAAGDYGATSSNPTIQLYYEYRQGQQAKGQPVGSFEDFQKMQNQLDINKAAATAYASEAAKNQADAAAGILTSKEQTAVDNANSVLKTNPEAQSFVTTAQSYLKILNLGNATDPGSQSAILASFIQMAVPGSKTLRGNSQVLSSMFGNTLSTALINAQKTVDDRGTLNSQDIASIEKAAGIIYASQYQTNGAVVQGIANGLNQQVGMTDAAKYLDDISQPLNSEVMGIQAKNDVNSYVQTNPQDKALIANFYAAGGLTDLQVQAWLKANGKIK